MLDELKKRGYSGPVVAKSTARFSDRNTQRRTSAQFSYGAFFVHTIPLAGCVWRPSGLPVPFVAGSLTTRFPPFLFSDIEGGFPKFFSQRRFVMSNQSTNSSIHHLPTGVVSYSLIWGLLAEYETLVRRLNYIIDTVPGEHYHESHEFLSDLIYEAKKEIEPYFEKANNEKATLGGNNVFVGKAVA